MFHGPSPLDDHSRRSFVAGQWRCFTAAILTIRKELFLALILEADVLGWKIGRPTFLDSIPVDACLALRCVGEWDFSPCLFGYS
ncbi:hypothetical protein TNCV_3974791 [Trichonephila clavipes]|nr:hypothetical protein TNCV_3974791 [Trichonephila clavipes]